MKKRLFAFSLLTSILFMSSCKSEKKEDPAASTPTASENTPEASEASVPSANEPKTYTVVATPDSASLGKNREALVRIRDIKLVELSDPDGKSKGSELTYKIELTNRNAIGAPSVGINTSNFRLELDNGQKIAPDSEFVSAQAEETKTSDEDKFEIPAGAKPVGLSLFMDDTRASIKLQLQ